MKITHDVRTNDTERATDGELQTPSTTEDNSNDESQPAPLSMEQLRNLLPDFLDLLIASPSPAATNESEDRSPWVATPYSAGWWKP